MRAEWEIGQTGEGCGHGRAKISETEGEAAAAASGTAPREAISPTAKRNVSKQLSQPNPLNVLCRTAGPPACTRMSER